MPRLDYTFTDALGSYVTMASSYKTFPIFAIAGLVFVLLIAFNIENKNANFIFYGLNIILLGIIAYSNGMDILNNIDILLDGNIFKNMYFYLLNAFVALIVVSKIYSSKRVSSTYKYIVMVLYYLLIVNLFFMIYVSNYFKNIKLLVIGNVYPMVYFGNIVCFIIYGSIILNWLVIMPKKKKHRLGNHL